MANIELAGRIGQDVQRIAEHLEQHDVIDASQRIEGIIAAIDILALNPLIGRPVDDGMRELIIGRNRDGYIALYHYDEAFDLVFVIAIRAQREAGYFRP
jgi:toxin ParE1/3/4